jgi:2-polyprenyl-3-methyl-5-hydroxy-6-metoxy-1,4-benzoquinol methylase
MVTSRLKGDPTSKVTEACPLCGSSQVSDFITAPDRFHWRPEVYRIARCGTCSGAWLVDPPKPTEMSRHYDEDYHRAIANAGESRMRWNPQHEAISKLKKGGALLDLGCSSGGFLSTMMGRSWRLYGIEMEASTAERARSRTGAEIFVGDVLEAPFVSDSFDVITCFDVLEHVYDPRQLLTKVLEWLKPGGIFYTSLPNIDSWEAQAFGSYWFGLELPRHTFHLSPRSLRPLMVALGFQEVYIRTPSTTYVERSIGYLRSALVQSLGFSPTSQAKETQRSLPWRAARKALRLTLVSAFGRMASGASRGGSMEAIFKK